MFSKPIVNLFDLISNFTDSITAGIKLSLFIESCLIVNVCYNNNQRI